MKRFVKKFIMAWKNPESPPLAEAGGGGVGTVVVMVVATVVCGVTVVVGTLVVVAGAVVVVTGTVVAGLGGVTTGMLEPKPPPTSPPVLPPPPLLCAIVVVVGGAVTIIVTGLEFMLDPLLSLTVSVTLNTPEVANVMLFPTTRTPEVLLIEYEKLYGCTPPATTLVRFTVCPTTIKFEEAVKFLITNPGTLETKSPV